MAEEKITTNLTFRFTDEGEYIFSVTELNTAVRDLLHRHFGTVIVQGEISNLKQAASGHMYFSLKDASGTIRCAFFRGQQFSLAFNPQDADHVTVKAKLSIYAERGDYQLVVEQLQHQGDGDLQAQFEALKRKLSAEGLFDISHKKPLPRFPKHIAVVTSATAAALQDVLNVLKRRMPLIPVTVYATQVQGATAPTQIIRALQTAEQEALCDVILLVRGGGSLEDLSCFNDEQLAYAVSNLTIPIVTGIGHEIDFTIVDFVADQRAPTPSAAAELVVPDQQELQQLIETLVNRLGISIKKYLQWQQQHILHLRQRLRHPQETLYLKSQHCDNLIHRLDKSIHKILEKKQLQYFYGIHRLQQLTPQAQIQNVKHTLNQQANRLHLLVQHMLAQYRETLAKHASKLDGLSPLATLERGYAIAFDATGKPIKSVESLKAGDNIDIKLAEGLVHSKVINTEK